MAFRLDKSLFIGSKIPLMALASVIPVVGLAYCAALAAPPKKSKAPIAAPTVAVTFEKNVAPVMKKYCISCHSGAKAAGAIALDTVTTTAQMMKVRHDWERVAANVEGGTMPPDGMPKPTAAEKETVAHFIQSAFTKADCNLNDPGRVTMRRLNRAEYNNTVRDLLGVDLRPADDFPQDDVGYGFDNIGDVLSLSPLLMEKYLRAAEKLARTAIRTPEDAERPALIGTNKMTGGREEGSGARSLFSAGEIVTSYDFPAAGKYEITVNAWGDQAGPDPVRLAVRLDGHDLRTIDIPGKRPRPYKLPIVTIGFAGAQKLSFAFLNDYFNDTDPNPKLRGDRNFYISSVTIKGPIGVKGLVGNLPESHRLIVTCTPQTADLANDVCSKTVARNFARRAYRRPPTAEEVGRLTRYIVMAKSAGLSFEKGVQFMVQAALVSPNFLFRVEPEPDSGLRRNLNDYELASRLSYFLWSSMPDDTLLALADKGELRKPEVLAAQAKRMLTSPKAHALTDNFAAQWLQLRSINIVTPDRAKFPTWNDSLRRDMRTETEMYFTNVVSEDRPILEFLDSKYTFMNERLARHYGNTAVHGEEFQRVELLGNQRGGLLTQASVLTVTSNPTRTSPVKRGKWVLDNILGTPPPPAPPNVPQLADDKAEKKPLTGTLRQRLEAHRKNPICASCHKRMDPIGFGLENYDAIGSWRLNDGDSPIDPSGTLADGRSFQGSNGLRKILLDGKDQFAKAFTERLLTYALGRGVVSRDQCNVKAMADKVAAKNYRFSAVVAEIVTSKPFREKHSDAPAGQVAKN